MYLMGSVSSLNHVLSIPPMRKCCYVLIVLSRLFASIVSPMRPLLLTSAVGMELTDPMNRKTPGLGFKVTTLPMAYQRP